MSQSKKEMMNRALNAMTINIGKSGVNDNVIEEIKRQLKANDISLSPFIQALLLRARLSGWLFQRGKCSQTLLH